MSISTKITFVLWARGLPHRIRGSTGLSSVPDPFVKILHRDNTTALWTEFATTKHVINSENPDWLEVISFDWKQGTGQLWRFEVTDYDVMSKDDVIGIVDVEVDKFVLENNRDLAAPLPNGGTIFIKGTTPFYFRLQVEDLPKLDTGSGSDPFVECYWSFGEDGQTQLFHTTKTVDNARNVKWNETIAFTSYQSGTNQFFTFKVYDEDTLKDDVIGQVSFNIDTLVEPGLVSVYRLSKDVNNQATLVVTPLRVTPK